MAKRNDDSSGIELINDNVDIDDQVDDNADMMENDGYLDDYIVYEDEPETSSFVSEAKDKILGKKDIHGERIKGPGILERIIQKISIKFGVDERFRSARHGSTKEKALLLGIFGFVFLAFIVIVMFL